MITLRRTITPNLSNDEGLVSRRFMKRHQADGRNRQGVSEVLGTLLLISIGVTLFSVLMLLVFNTSILFESQMVPTANIIVHYDGSGNITFENRGGEPIPLTSKVTLNFADITPVHFTVADYLTPPPGPNDKYWTVGERVVYNASAIPNLNNLEIKALIVDSSSKSVLMKGTIREGSAQAVPFVITQPPKAVTTRSEFFNLSFDYQLYYPHIGWQYWVRFSYRKASDVVWTSTAWTLVAVKSGLYTNTVTGLTPGTDYVVKGEACWGLAPTTNPVNYTSGTTRSFETGTDYVGLWHFEEQTPTNLTTIIDSTINHNNGTLAPILQTIMPQRLAGIHSGRGILFDSINDMATVPDSTSLRVFGNDTTIECWVKPQSNREGRKGVIVSNDVSHFSQFLENYSCTDPDVIYVGGTYYAIVSRGANQHGYLITVNITNAGQIISPNLTSSIVSVLDFDTTCWQPKIINISGTVYAIVYSRGSTTNDRCQGYLKTVSISTKGVIGSIIGSYYINVNYFYQPKILHLTGLVYAVFYNNGYNNYQLQVMTCNIPTVGNPTIITTFSFSLVTYDPAIVQVGSAPGMYTYSIVYRDSDSDGYVASLNITSSGLAATQIDQDTDPNSTTYSIMIDSDDCWLPSIVPVSNTNRYVLAYTGSVNKYKDYGFIKTLWISTMGILHNGTYEFVQDYKIIDGSTSGSGWVFNAPRIIAVDNDTYAVEYQYSSSSMAFGLVQTIGVNATGNITYAIHNPASAPGYNGAPAEAQRYTFEMLFGCLTPTIFRIQAVTDPYTFAVVYSRQANLSNQGMVKTFNISTAGNIIQPRISEAILGSKHMYNPYLFPVNGSIYAMVYNSEYNTGLTVTTIRILPNGDVQDNYIDTVTLPSGRVLSTRMRQIQSNVFCLAYYNFSSGVKIRTIHIASNGIIDHVYDRIWSYSTSYICNVDFIKINDNAGNDIYAVSFRNMAANTGSYALTVHINSVGNVTGPIDVFTMADTTNYNVLYDTTLTRVEGSVGGSLDIFALTYSFVYGTTAGAGKILTLQINVNTGAITDFPVATYTFDTAASKAALTRISGDVYALAYTDKTPYDHIKTFHIADDGSSVTLIDPGPTGASYCSQILPFNTTKYIYGAISEAGIIRTFRINNLGDISNVSAGAGGSQFYDNQRTLTNALKLRGIKINGNVYAFIYQGLYNDAYILTLTINAVATMRGVLVKSGAYNVSADATTVYVSMTDNGGTIHSTSALLSYTTDWNYIVVCYKVGNKLRLYINGNDSAHNGRYSATSELMPSPVKSISRSIYFGDYNAIYDEFGIGTKVFTEAEIKTTYLLMLT